MIDKNEIRIGDFIMTDDDKIIWVSEIQHLKHHKEWVFTGWHEETKERLSVNFFDAKPIILTKKCMLKFGFSKTHQNVSSSHRIDYFIINGNFFDCPIQIGSDGFYYNKLKVPSVHQLQNLYFALTGKELEFQKDTI